MKILSKILFALPAIVLLSACGPKDVQPIQSLSGIEVEEFNVSSIDVVLSPEFVNQVEAQIAKEKENIKLQNERIDNPPGRTSLSRKQNADVARGRLEESEKKIVSITEEMNAIESDVKESLQAMLEDQFSGNRNVDVDVSINSFSLTNGAAVVLIGGSDSMSGILKISDSQTSNLLGEYYISDMDTNAAGGLLGLMVRGGDARGDMIKQFSEKVSDVIAGKYVD